MERIKLSIDPKDWREIKRLARAEGTSGAAWIRRAIKERLQRERVR